MNTFYTIAILSHLFRMIEAIQITIRMTTNPPKQKNLHQILQYILRTILKMVLLVMCRHYQLQKSQLKNIPTKVDLGLFLWVIDLFILFRIREHHSETRLLKYKHHSSGLLCKIHMIILTHTHLKNLVMLLLAVNLCVLALF